MRTCPSCGTQNRSGDAFCVGCGDPLPSIVASGASRQTQTQFSLPDYLRRDAELKRRRALAPEGSGSGLVWTGLPLAIGALLWSSGSTLGNTLWAGGLVMIVVGFWRMRRDRRALGRAGLATAVVGTIALGAVVLQLLERPPAPAEREAPAAAGIGPTAVHDWESPATPGVVAGAVPMFGGGPEHTGEQPGPGPAGRPTLRWREDTGGELYSSPAVVDGALYLGTKSGFLSSLDAATGAERWRADLGGYIVRASPAVAGGSVFVGAGYALFALDAATGEERWRVPTRFAGASSPVVADGVVYAATQEGHVYAVDAVTKDERWHVQVEGLIFSSPAVADGRLFVGTDDGNLYAIDADTGRGLWDFATGGEVYAAPAVADGLVFVSSTSGTLYALDTITGEERWQAEVGGEASPAVADGVVYLGGEDGGLHALEAATGRTRWLFPTGHPVRSGPALVGDTIFVCSGPTVYAVDAASGARRWAYPTGKTIETTPAVVGGVVFVGSRDGYLYAIGGTEAPAPLT